MAALAAAAPMALDHANLFSQVIIMIMGCTNCDVRLNTP